MATNRDIREKTKGLLSGIKKSPQEEGDVSTESVADPVYIQELNDEIQELRQQIEGAMIRRGNAYNFRRFQLTPVGLVSPENIGDQEFIELGVALSSLSGAVNFWLGDWANLYIDQRQKRKGAELSEEERSEIYEELVRDFGLSSERSLRQYASVCRNVSPSIRIDGVSFSHHQLVAFLPQRLKGRESEFLERAEGLSVDQLRLLIREESSKLLPAKAKPSFDPSPLIKEFKAVTRVMKIKKPSHLPEDEKADYRATILKLRQILDDIEGRLGD